MVSKALNGKSISNDKLILALLLLCLANMPYSYFQLVRFFSLIGLWLFSISIMRKRRSERFYYLRPFSVVISAILKIELGRLMWNIVDVFLSIALNYQLYQA
ncbi:DUF6804 family protein [Pedobacter sp. MC2016-05]|uniref:DUF6804 family protein n=1 Tax=Pedobacter sp. MC2016-05 TaxID=2994474 RepID=UPI003A521DDE